MALYEKVNNTETVNRKISDIYDAMADMQIYKNTS